MDLNTSIRRLKFYWATEWLTGPSLQEGGNAFITSIFGDFDKDVCTALKAEASTKHDSALQDHFKWGGATKRGESPTLTK